MRIISLLTPWSPRKFAHLFITIQQLIEICGRNNPILAPPPSVELLVHQSHFHSTFNAYHLSVCIIQQNSSLWWGWVFFKSRLQNDVRRLGRGLAGLFSQQILLNLIKRCSNQHAEIFMNETNMRRFESVFTNRITSSWHQKSKISKRIVLIENTLLR